MKNKTDRFDISQRGGMVGDRPVTPIVNIILATKITSQDGSTTLTPDLCSEKEVDYWVESLKHDLDYMGKLAKLALQTRKAQISN